MPEKKTRELPLLPLRGVVVFPYMVIHLDVGRDKSVKAIDEAMTQDRVIFLAMQKEAQTDEPEIEDIFSTGTIAEVKQLLKLPGGTIRVLVEGLGRGEIEGFIQEDPYFKVSVTDVVEREEKTPEVEALMRVLVETFENYVKISKRIPPETVVSVVTIEEPTRFADVIASQLTLRVSDKQSILETKEVSQRLELLYEILTTEMEILELERQISSRVRKQMEKSQKEYYLREQIKAIQKELGDKEDRASEAQELREKIEQVKMPKQAKEKALQEVERLEKMPPMVAESVVVRNYIDWLLSLPWSKSTRDRLDIDEAQTILDEDHYGLTDVKDRILEYLAIRKLAKKMKGPIICFVGPPGVGKTSLAKSVARALQRKFVRISLGGIRDEAEIRGHRRTYVGAMPGRIIQGMKQVESKNPVFLMDEIDKMSMDFRGDPASALLEVLDPEQNNTFSDHFIEVPYDLSKVLFITTANVEYAIPGPLLDRMEVIYLPGYTEQEKLQIALRHLVGKQLDEHGLTDKQLELSENALRRIIREYTREAGVRNLERQIATICRKAARDIVAGKTESIHVTAKTVEKWLGIPRYHFGIGGEKDQVGVATGLAWTEVGGEVLSVEASIIPGKGNVMLTGKLGDVMKESAQAGISYIRSRANELGLDPEFHQKYDVHIHLPEGAIPKDGPSAGITMATALISSLTGKPIKKDVAMTGEITLRGRVLPVGGIKEKVLAAHRAGMKTIIIPKENEKYLEEIPKQVKRKIKFVLVEHLDEVLPIAIDGGVALGASGDAEQSPTEEALTGQ